MSDRTLTLIFGKAGELYEKVITVQGDCQKVVVGENCVFIGGRAMVDVKVLVRPVKRFKCGKKQRKALRKYIRETSNASTRY